ncbi:hypothetical protein E4U42_006099 [Claviceps africana]|uniref:Uncharacterized protein n=1 Tax=Claviceps africana TaxID=83212 RepID=A0A8K0NGZ2_9HYPO|nr:hypothetical protein E4U42_006099 [Claviceps africana]
MSKPVDIPSKPKDFVDGPGSQFCGDVYCGSPQLIAEVTPSGQVIEKWGVPPKPGDEKLPMPRPPRKTKAEKRQSKKK